ncbi:MAG: Spy/CpxP family protein refolding chaperone [Acidobacteriota bacterium]
MRRTLITLSIAVFLVAAGAVAQGRRDGAGMGGWHAGAMGEAAGGGGARMVAALTQVLQLTPDQVTAWQKIRDNTKATIQPLAQQERQLHQDIRAALQAGGADATTIGTKMIAAHDLQTRIKAARDAGQSALRALLTPDQQAKFDVLQQARSAIGPRHRMGPPPQQ